MDSRSLIATQGATQQSVNVGLDKTEGLGGTQSVGMPLPFLVHRLSWGWEGAGSCGRGDWGWGLCMEPVLMLHAGTSLARGSILSFAE